MNENRNYNKRMSNEDVERIRAIILAMTAQRKNLGMSQRKLAEICGMPQSTIGRIETFKATPNLGTVLRMMHYLGMELVVNEQVSEEIREEIQLWNEVEKGIKSGEEEGWISHEEVKRSLGI